MKLSKKMQEALDFYINAPYADYKGVNGVLHLNEETTKIPYYGLLEDGTIRTKDNTQTIKGLEKRGLIEAVVIGGDLTDMVKLVQHKNNNKSVFETRNLVEVEIFLISNNDKEQKNNERNFLEDGNIENLKRYYDNNPSRANVSRVINKETREEIYSNQN